MNGAASFLNANFTPERQSGHRGCLAVESDDLSIGIVVPVFNEAATLAFHLEHLYEVTHQQCPVVVVDGGSTDGSTRIARRFFHTEIAEQPSRGGQLNHGARRLWNDVLLFLHADSQLPRGFDYFIRCALRDPEVAGGCSRLQFGAAHPLLRFYCRFTRLPGRFFHFGDQGFFVRREVFWKMGGFHPLPFLEDVDFLRRLN